MDYVQIQAYLWLGFGFIWLILALTTKRTRVSEGYLSRTLHLGPTFLAFSLDLSIRFHLGILGKRFIPALPGAAKLGILITGLGLALTLWARLCLGRNWSGVVTLKEDHKLVKTGPYAWVRHPIYLGILTAYLGTALTVGEIRGILGLLLLACTFWRKIQIEETFLAQHFGERFIVYKRQVKALIPRIL